MKIEEATKNDTNQLIDLARRTILESVSADIEIKREIIADTTGHIENNISTSNKVFLKCSDPTILGFILIQNYWNLSDLFVLPESHGKGIGKQLFHEARVRCIGNTDRSYIRVNSSLNAEGFYRKIGFVTYTPENKAPSYVVPLIYNF